MKKKELISDKYKSVSDDKLNPEVDDKSNPEINDKLNSGTGNKSNPLNDVYLVLKKIICFISKNWKNFIIVFLPFIALVLPLWFGIFNKEKTIKILSFSGILLVIICLIVAFTICYCYSHKEKEYGEKF